jgi:hypothetical protein
VYVLSYNPVSVSEVNLPMRLTPNDVRFSLAYYEHANNFMFREQTELEVIPRSSVALMMQPIDIGLDVPYIQSEKNT